MVLETNQHFHMARDSLNLNSGFFWHKIFKSGDKSKRLIVKDLHCST